MTEVVINKDDFKVNDGKPFELPEMTVKKHEAILREMADSRDKYTNLEYSRALQKELIYKSLKEVDKTVTKEMIESLHPTEFSDLSDAVWEAGRTDDDKKFRVGEQKSKEDTK